ncbi:AEC family transporter [Geothermobacter hydrogeniphilus]|uniref:Transporter n=1 Tax=Geothermobacter hydrogeniphilus TaxID=1969733 RepID=A0A1X0Y0H1_9BACT|nr:AEC family transporter [Geothermobacter hydrogeniphilus]ORJ58616.1 transporter [Geothermobacter hydrogeniphilus]
MSELFTVFLNVILPVFGIIALGYLLGNRLALQARTLTRVAYYVFVPAFIFQALSQSGIPLSAAAKLIGVAATTHLLAALVAGGLARLLGRSREMIAAFVMIASFGNVGNYGLAVIRFRLGEAALAPATIYFVAITIVAFVVCVSAAGWARGGGSGALKGLLRTPALWATIPGLAVANSHLTVPLVLSRMIGLLADAMIPVMLFALGLQLLEQKRVRLSPDVFAASAIRLLLAPALAALIALSFGLGQIDFAAGVLQAGMPTAVLVAIIARENDIVPDFVTSVVLVSTLASLATLTLTMVLL